MVTFSNIFFISLSVCVYLATKQRNKIPTLIPVEDIKNVGIPSQLGVEGHIDGQRSTQTVLSEK